VRFRRFANEGKRVSNPRTGRALSKIDVEYGLDDMLKFRDNVFVLFYVSWYPFSQRFLPIFEKFAQGKAQSCLRVKTDDKASLCEKARALRLTLSIAALTAKNHGAITAGITVIVGSAFFRFIQSLPMLF